MKKIVLVLLSVSVLLSLGACSSPQKEKKEEAGTSSVTKSKKKVDSSSTASSESIKNAVATSSAAEENSTTSSAVQDDVTAPEAESSESTATTDWTSMEEAIIFYENTYKNTSNELSKNIAWENYDRSCWSVTEQSGNRILLHWSNIGGAGGSYDEFVKGPEYTELTIYDGNASYPNSPSVKYTIRNSDFTVTNTENFQ